MKKNLPHLVVATRNAGKIREIERELKGLAVRVRGLDDFPQIGEIEETGTSFAENAQIKARTVHRIAGGYVLSDDSGLECEDLGGAPGIYSARFAGSKATDEQNNQKLIESITATHDPSRVARYVCAIVLIEPSGREHLVEDTCEGVITMTPSGSGGFGYDPYFYLLDKKCTMAELDPAEKNRISHRGKALRRILPILKVSLT